MKPYSIVLVLALLTGCADYVNLADAQYRLTVGFWHGVWHGIILPLSWTLSLFSDQVALYAIYNNGGWYDTGFIMGIAIIATFSLSSN